MLSQIAKIQEPVWLNTQVVDTTSGEPSITEADVRQSSTWCLLKSRNQMYHGFFLYQGIDGYKEKYIDLVQANVAQSVFVITLFLRFSQPINTYPKFSTPNTLRLEIRQISLWKLKPTCPFTYLQTSTSRLLQYSKTKR